MKSAPPSRSAEPSTLSTARALVTGAALFATTVAIPVIGTTPSADASGFACESGPSYEVQRGDSWWSIANRLEVSIGSLLDRNDAGSSDMLVPGDGLCLPDGADPTKLCELEVVRPGDGWIVIASRVGVSVAALTAVNGADASRVLHPGNELCLPAGATASEAPPTSTGSSSSAAAASSSSSSSSGASGSAGSSAAGSSYTVRAGDTWFGLAAQMGVTPRALLGANSASADDLLLIGRVLTLPDGATAPEAAPTSSGWVQLDAAPVQGPCDYIDTWLDPRPRGRRHLGADLFTAHRAYVYAVADGTLTGRRWAGSGTAAGNAWSLTTGDGTRYFYAHLYDFNPELRVGSTVRAGEILGWVGGTGNASADHLHLEIRPQGGSPINPYPVLRAQGGCNDGRPYQQPSGWWPS